MDAAVLKNIDAVASIPIATNKDDLLKQLQELSIQLNANPYLHQFFTNTEKENKIRNKFNNALFTKYKQCVNELRIIAPDDAHYNYYKSIQDKWQRNKNFKRFLPLVLLLIIADVICFAVMTEEKVVLFARIFFCIILPLLITGSAIYLKHKRNIKSQLLTLLLLAAGSITAQETDIRMPDTNQMRAFTSFYGYGAVKKLPSDLTDIFSKTLYTKKKVKKLSKSEAQTWQRYYKTYIADKEKKDRLEKYNKERLAKADSIQRKVIKLINDNFTRDDTYRELSRFANQKENYIEDKETYDWLRQYLTDEEIIDSLWQRYGNGCSNCAYTELENGYRIAEEYCNDTNAVKNIKESIYYNITSPQSYYYSEIYKLWNSYNSTVQGDYLIPSAAPVYKNPDAFIEACISKYDKTKYDAKIKQLLEKACTLTNGKRWRLGMINKKNERLRHLPKVKTLMDSRSLQTSGVLIRNIYDGVNGSYPMKLPYKTINGKKVIDGLCTVRLSRTQLQNATGSNYREETYDVTITMNVQNGKVMSISCSGKIQNWIPNINILKNYRTEYEQKIALSRAEPIVDKTQNIKSLNDFKSYSVLNSIKLLEKRRAFDNDKDLLMYLIKSYDSVHGFGSEEEMELIRLQIEPLDFSNVRHIFK